MSAVTTPGPSSGTRQEMFDKFQPWVLATYGDSAKTKTITLKKAIKIQAGLMNNSPETLTKTNNNTASVLTILAVKVDRRPFSTTK